ncbi:hypothetical protein [Geomobilimonas luticola]|uniref:DUF2905 family protein n=1 Tax=Geomobilimonas luticola TaxID=1114878 RepID=A0ABS5SCG9_9BACT|nr:hypothetical protein [Geomobilimonas luticola]MBT0653062.1 hypothetical protein [Geomobilimonas luticola]
MSFEWMIPYLLVAVIVFLAMKIPGWIGKKRGAQPAFVPHYTYVMAGVFLLCIVIYVVVKFIFVVVHQ